MITTTITNEIQYGGNRTFGELMRFWVVGDAATASDVTYSIKANRDILALRTWEMITTTITTETQYYVMENGLTLGTWEMTTITNTTETQYDSGLAI